MEVPVKFESFVDSIISIAIKVLDLKNYAFDVNYVHDGEDTSNPFAYVQEQDDMSFLEGTYSVFINVDQLKLVDMYDIIYDLFHEIRHVFQRQILFEYEEYDPCEYTWKLGQYAHAEEWFQAQLEYNDDMDEGMESYKANLLEADANMFAQWLFEALFCTQLIPADDDKTEEIRKEYMSLYGKKIDKIKNKSLNKIIDVINMKYTEFIK